MASNQAPEASRAQLWSNEGLLRAAFENSIDGILITSPDGRIHAANPQACRILQMTEREICQGGRDNLVDLADPRVPGLLQERARTGHCQGDVTMRKQGGTQFEAEISSSVFREQGLERAINIFRDISERKQAEQERERLIAQLQEALQKIKTLTGLLPICAHCKKIRDAKGNWTQFENYISEQSHATFSHSVCPVCLRQFYPEISKKQNP